MQGSLNIKKVWLKRDEQEILVPVSDILPGDRVIIHMGNVIPFDGEVSCGEGMVNQASLTENLFRYEDARDSPYMRELFWRKANWKS